MPKLRFAAAILSAVAALGAFAQSTQPPRPKVALVLSGGGARGLAHIGALKALRDARVPVDLIVATSMGSIVGGAYAAGHTPEQMESLLATADWDQIFSDRAPREFLSFRRKADDLRLIGKSELGLKDGGVVLPRGALGSQNLEEFLRRIAHPASDARTLNDLPILFRAVATDLATGKQVVLEDVPLPVAMRASMSIPGAFAPSEIGGRLLGDGGLVRNLPVEVARQMGADVIIAVNVGTPLLPREALSSAFGVAQQMINILTEQNVEISLKALRPGDILISPDLAGVSFVDFDQGPELIARGEAATRGQLARLAALAWEPEKYAAWEARRTRAPESHQLPIWEVVVKGAERTNPVAVERELEGRAGIARGALVTDTQLVEGARILHGWGDFERVDVRTEFDKGHRNVVVDLSEKSWGPDYLRIGGLASSDFQTDSRFSLTMQHSRRWVNTWGAEWRNEITLGETRRFGTNFLQPLGPGSPWFLEAQAEAVKYSTDLFDNDYRRTDRLTLTQKTLRRLARAAPGQLGRRAAGRRLPALPGEAPDRNLARRPFQRQLAHRHCRRHLRHPGRFQLPAPRLHRRGDRHFPPLQRRPKSGANLPGRRLHAGHVRAAHASRYRQCGALARRSRRLQPRGTVRPFGHAGGLAPRLACRLRGGPRLLPHRPGAAQGARGQRVPGSFPRSGQRVAEQVGHSLWRREEGEFRIRRTGLDPRAALLRLGAHLRRPVGFLPLPGAADGSLGQLMGHVTSRTHHFPFGTNRTRRFPGAALSATEKSLPRDKFCFEMSTDRGTPRGLYRNDRDRPEADPQRRLLPRELRVGSFKPPAAQAACRMP